jgi:adhesin/invasin
MQKKIKIFLLSISLIFSSSYIANAQNLLQDNINHSLNKLGATLSLALPGAGDTEIITHSQNNYDLRYSLSAVRSLSLNPYSELSNKHLYFSQFRIANHEPYSNGDQRMLFNVGLGFRTLVHNNNATLGVNLFYDHEFEQTHQRASLGLEYLTSTFEVYANKYQRLSETSNYGLIRESVLNGHDINLIGQLPYMPWGKVVYNNYSFAGTSSDTKGERLSLEAQVLRHMIFEIGQSTPDVGSTEDFWKLKLRWPANQFKQTIVSHTVTEHMFPEKNMSSKMLSKVRRTNEIASQKRTVSSGRGRLELGGPR